MSHIPRWWQQSRDELRASGIHCRLFLLRHGESDRRAQGRCHGQLDIPLSPDGVAQADRMAQALAELPFTRIGNSPLRRAAQTADALRARIDAPHFEDARFTEIDFGAFEGRRYEEIEANEPERYATWMQRPWEVQFPEGESHAQLQTRAAAGLADLLAHEQRGVTLLVSHAGIIRSLLARYLTLPPAGEFKLGLSYAGLSCIDHFEEGCVVRFVNWELGS